MLLSPISTSRSRLVQVPAVLVLAVLTGCGLRSPIAVTPSSRGTSSEKVSAHPTNASASSQLANASFLPDVVIQVSRPVRPARGLSPGLIDRISVDDTGGQLPGDSMLWFAGMSGTGRYIAFDYFPVDRPNAVQHVFVRDTCFGAASGCAPTTVLASAAEDGTPGNGANLDAAISADGRFVAFSSYSSNLVTMDTNGFGDVIVRDTCIGAPMPCIPSTTRVSLANDGSQGNGDSHWPTISATGRFVAFYSDATNLVPNDTNGVGGSFVRDTCIGAPSGCVPTTARTSVANDGSEGNGKSGIPSISGTGRFVAFDSWASNLVPGDANDGFDVFVRDTCAGAGSDCVPSTVLVSAALNGSPWNFGGSAPVISANGRYVSFGTETDVFVRDTCLGDPPSCEPSTLLVSPGTGGGYGPWGGWWAPISGDGRYVVFPAGDNVFLRDTCISAPLDCVPHTLLVSVALDGSPLRSGPYGDSLEVSISPDGQLVAFDSLANNIVPGDTNFWPGNPQLTCIDVFLFKRWR